MSSKKERILIVHPEGNIFNNPNLYSIIRHLSKHFQVDILVPKLKINEEHFFLAKKINVIEYSEVFTEENLLSNLSYLELYITNYISNSYSLILGVDRLGLILSYLLSKFFIVPYAYISYEIFFQNETLEDYKNIEILASKDVLFAIVQDKYRAQLLSQENKISLSKMQLIPVASSHTNIYKKSHFLHDKFNIDRDTKILLFIGSIGYWSCINPILDELRHFPKNWIIVFHDRYGQSKKKIQKNYKKDINRLKNIYFSNIKIAKTEEMSKIIHSADIGLSLYCPNHKSKFTGKNLKYIGMSSGKISTYLQNGLPIITTNNKALSKYINDYNVGFEIDNAQGIVPILRQFKANSMNENCIKFFEGFLSYNNYKKDLLALIKKSLKKNRTSQKLITKNKKSKIFKELTKKNNESKFNTHKALEFSASFNKFYDLMQELKKVDSRYVIYGKGKVGKTIQLIMPDNVWAFVDMNSDIISNTFKKGNVYNPKSLKNMEYDKIIISVLGREDGIIKYLVRDLGIDQDRIITI